MKASCPLCRVELLLENINVESDVGVCHECGELTSLSSLVAVAIPAADSVPPSFSIDRPPAGAWFQDTPERFTVGATTRSIPTAIFLVPFTLVWSGGSLGGIYGSQIVGEKFNLLLSLFGLPFLLGSIMLITAVLMAMFGRVTVDVEHGQGRVFTGVAGIGWTRRFSWSEVDAIIADQTVTSRRRAQQAIALEGATRIPFGTNLSEERRYFVLNALKTLKAERLS